MRSVRRLSILVCLGVLLVHGAFAGELPDGFRLEPVLAGLTEPSALAFTTDQRILVTERTTGRVRVVSGGQLQPGAICTVAVNTTGEAGLLGIAVHPQYASRGWIYLYYTDLGTGKNRVVRYTIQGNACTDPTTILGDLGAGAGFLRNGGGLAFGPDGKLYVGTGDVQTPANGQDAGVLPAKILRVNDDGTIPADNPTTGSYVYARGVRDGRGLAVSAAGEVFATDRGQDLSSAHDELNAVAADGNLGWAIETGGGGGLDAPLVAWLPTVGVHGLALNGATNYPDLSADGLDNDHDRFGPDRMPGKRRTDDNGTGLCVGGTNNNNPCTSNAQCPPRAGEAVVFCQLLDDLGEWCLSPDYDDGCLGGPGAIGLDEPDESYAGDLFGAATEAIQRAVISGVTMSNWESFLDSTPLNDPTPPPPPVTDCPTGWTGVALGRDGWIYGVARNTGGATGGLYRVIHEGAPGPREVSPPKSPFPLQLGKGASPAQLVIYWEDLRLDSLQPRDTGSLPAPPAREYTIWKGTLGSYYSHAPLPGFTAEPGSAINDGLRAKTISTDPGSSEYFLVSARNANLEGTTGRNSTNVERPGYAVTDLCPGLGYHPGGANPPLFRCGRDFTLQDEFAVTRSLYEHRGRVIVFDLSAEWCGPCHSQANVMENLYRDYKDRGVVMFSVLMDEWNQAADFSGRPTPTSCRDWADRPGPDPAIDHSFDCWADPNGGPQLSWTQYGTGSLPTNIIIDQGMRVAYVGQGYDEAGIRARLDSLVGAADTCLP